LYFVRQQVNDPEYWGVSEMGTVVGGLLPIRH